MQGHPGTAPVPSLLNGPAAWLPGCLHAALQGDVLFSLLLLASLAVVVFVRVSMMVCAKAGMGGGCQGSAGREQACTAGQGRAGCCVLWGRRLAVLRTLARVAARLPGCAWF